MKVENENFKILNCDTEELEQQQQISRTRSLNAVWGNII